MSTQPCVFIVDDDYAVRDGLGLVIETAGLPYQAFESAEQFLQSYCPSIPGCLLLDVNMPGLNGLELQAELIRHNIHLPIIFLTGNGNIPMTVRAIKAGAVDFLTKPVPSKLLIERIQAVLQHEAQIHEQNTAERALSNRLNSLTSREMEILPLVVEGHSNKDIARLINISFRTVEIHRARILKKTGVANLLELARLCEACKLPSEPTR
ncbi:Nodulation protein W [Crenothrix polyspora]|jgi:FixJ family two-component response regulator|uniref:Nodulation protein W n=1 Tax=Crenothrix polyspora TaxID=360316 RepID=A0A1R4H7F5_9GAMM|nr:response regulator [Crenothrix polyspora]SJM92116.1 Nodulation protein W [Crenothrix polyspora]